MLTVAVKELLDALRDVRSLASSGFYCLMGPGVVWMVSRAVKGERAGAVLAGMISVFVLVAAFSGGMNVAMDAVAGERERKSLVPLLANPLPRLDIIMGKWLAVTIFSAAGLLLCLLAFRSAYTPAGGGFLLVWLTGLLPLAFLAAALEVGLSTLCGSIKEAHTYLSMLVFVPMVIGMAGVFFPVNSAVYAALPVAGQQVQINQWFSGRPVALLPSLFLSSLTIAVAAAVLRGTALLLERDEAIYGR